MMPPLKRIVSQGVLPLGIIGGALLGWWMASSPGPAASTPTQAQAHPLSPKPSAATPEIPAEAVPQPESPAAPAAPVSPADHAPADFAAMSLDELRIAWDEAPSMGELQAIAQELASRNNADSVQLLMQAIGSINDWPSRSELSKSLRGVSDPDTLSALLPAVLNNYGRGNTILNEIADAIGRMAQPDTVETLALMHWQASTQAGQGHKVLRTVAGIRNPPAKRALLRLSEHAENPALAAAATEALKNFIEATP